MAMPKVPAVPAFQVKVNGETVTVDHRTFTMAERRKARVGLLQLSEADDLAPDEGDVLASLLWTTLARSRPELTIQEVFESMTLGELQDGDPVPDADTDGGSDPEA